MKKCVIIGARPVSEKMLQYCTQAQLIIAADAGWIHAHSLGLKPDFYVGDYDSAPVPTHSGTVVRLPREKDDTDMLFAAKQALEQGCTEVVLLGGMGGRADHTMANIQTLLFLQSNGVCALLAQEDCEIRVMGCGTYELNAKQGWYCSLFSFSEQAVVEYSQGLRYPLMQTVLSQKIPLGVSNEFTAQRAKLCIRSGIVLCMLCRQDDTQTYV